MIGVICPSIFEYKALSRVKFPKKNVTLVKSGMGKVRALDACHVLARQRRLEAILLVGFAGSLTDSLKIGDVIEPNVFIEQDYNAEPFEKFPNRIEKKGKLLAESHQAAMLTQDRFLTENPYRGTAYEKRYKKLACDMESYAVAYFCRLYRVRYSVVKLISDTADPQADHDFLKACRQLSPKLNRVVSQAVSAIK